MRIVIVEDEIRIREGITKLLTKMSSEYDIVGEAENGEEGLTLINETCPDLIITDIKMPAMDGLEMLAKVYENKSPVKAIVLSAYSEFEYARQAMKLGVTEYLLKPIAMSDFSLAMEHVKSQIDKEGIEKPQQLGSLEQIMEGILSGSIIPDDEIYRFLENRYKVVRNMSMAAVCFYLGGGFEENATNVKREIRMLAGQTKDSANCIIALPYDKILAVVFYGFKDGLMLERWVQNQMQNNANKAISTSVGWMLAGNITRLADQINQLKKSFDWNISLGDGVVISYPKVSKIQTVPCIYPVQIENRMKIAICGNDQDKIAEETKAFQEYFKEGKVYAPKEIKECYVRFLWSVINVAKEIGNLQNQNLQQQKLLETIMSAKTLEELRLAMQEILSLIDTNQYEGEITHLTVKRTVNMVQEFYTSGITLEEIADKLHITPEYLGTQFHKVMGITFSTYMKNVKMAKAKELLIGTQLKLYEIAQKVGYTDSKYFSKVFKEAFGQLPADYRKTHR